MAYALEAARANPETLRIRAAYHAAMTEMTRWFDEHAARLTTIDPDAELDDLTPLGEIVGDARVVALGEGAHFVAEFAQARARIIRYLVQHCGFSVLLAEYGFAAGFPTEAWLRGERSDDLVDLGGALATSVNGALLRWLRSYNANAQQVVGFGGIDLPINASLLPVLDPVQDFLADVDPDVLPSLRRARELAESISGGSAVLASNEWSQLGTAEQNELTAILHKLTLRVQTLEPVLVDRGGRVGYDLAVRHLDAARRLDYMYAVMVGVFSGTDLPGDASVRDRYMADSVHWHLHRLGAETKVILVAHNMHIQKTPVRHDGGLSALPMGHYLDRELGEQYRTLALTHTGGTVPEMDVAPGDSAVGFTVVETELELPATGSVEAELVQAGLGQTPSLTDVRGLPFSIPQIRGQSALTDTPIPDSFDAVLNTPTATIDPTLPF